MNMKRFFDLLMCVFALMIFLVPGVLVALVVWLTSEGPIIYWSDRVGRNKHLFKMPKFRTMQMDTPTVATHLMTNPEQYLTPIGSFLRKSSLDELPQLWCIMKGEMAFVGPRPAVVNEGDLHQLRIEKGIDKLVPGLTGWAQVNGRDELSVPLKVALDLEYMERQSLGLDLYILWLTFLKVIRRDAVSH